MIERLEPLACQKYTSGNGFLLLPVVLTRRFQFLTLSIALLFIAFSAICPPVTDLAMWNTLYNISPAEVEKTLLACLSELSVWVVCGVTKRQLSDAT